MSLYWPADKGDVVTDGPRLHAFVIGVGDYDHLGLNVAKPANLLNGIADLTITTPAARRVARWLETEYNNPACPLGSIELLLSPGETLNRADNTTVQVEKATMAAIQGAFKDWYQRCNEHEGNIAFFYFAGHGINTISQFLLPADFGNPDEPDDWENCIDGTGLQSGMAKCKAKTQLFFFDACRDAPISALTSKNPHGKPLVTANFGDQADVSADYLAASEGRKAYGRDGEETYFCKALMMCLDGAAARKAGPKWSIDTAMLGTALAAVVDILAKKENQPLSCDCPAQKPVPLHFPRKAQVLLKVDSNDPQRSAEADIEVHQGQIVYRSQPGEARPWTESVDPGDTRVEIRYQSFPDEAHDDRLMPPTYELDLPI